MSEMNKSVNFKNNLIVAMKVCQQNHNRRIYWQETVRKFIFALDAGQI